MKRLRTRTWSSPGSSSSRTASSKSSPTGSPCGRRARRISRVSMPRTVGSGAMELAGRHIVVTGGARGIGRACALRFADEGARVTVADLDVQGAIKTAEEIGGHAVGTDVGREQEILALIDEAERRQGPIDAFFSNAGISGAPGGPTDLLDEDWDVLWRVNVMSHIWAARELVPKMLERKEGYLLSTASAAGLLSQLGAIGYATAKHAAVAVAE